MIANGLDRLSYQSRWYSVAPERKCALWLVMMVLACVLPPAGQAALLLALALFTCWLLRISPGRWLRFMALPMGFLLCGVVTILFSLTREPRHLVAGIPLCGVWLGVTPEGLATANATLWRSLASLAATLWLMLNLPFVQLIILLKRGRVPRLLTEQILLTWRFIFILLDEAAAIHRAQTLRFGYRSLPLSYRSLSMLVGLLFTRVLLRYKAMAVTLDIKLYQGDFHL
ncbi:energy-coupling factor ABC transporter transmembrane protein [Vagococcus sp. WN89Y]|uniref:energy-coupling factor ABC transporter transmembrane protein n=1 Tax=Vagococcus sp. WN89Y TaxID=3457258 RepID=UPI003FCE29DD